MAHGVTSHSCQRRSRMYIKVLIVPKIMRYLARGTIQHPPHLHPQTLQKFNMVLSLFLTIHAVLCCLAASCLIFLLVSRNKIEKRKKSKRTTGSKDAGISINKTQILKCHLSHHRMFPQKHAFIYPYLSIGVPVRSPSSNWLLSIDEINWWKRGWLYVSAKDHLDRGRYGDTLSTNLDAYLEQQVI
jgi:hypothetical protein